MDKSVGSFNTEQRVRRTEVVKSESRSMGDASTCKPGGGAVGRIDQYTLLRELGGGGFGTVFLARDTVAGVDVAVKGLPPLVRNNADELERIRENFALVSKLYHPHIAAALHLHLANHVWYESEGVKQALRVLTGDTLMVMAYAPGVTLSKWRRQYPDGRVPVEEALEVCRQIAEALDYAHGEKVVHRDIKPSNVMIETREKRLNTEERKPELCVRVLDFGLAAEIRSSLSRVSQEKGDTSGTRPYMAPEQWAGQKQDGRTDLYALAVLFHELISGAVPFASAFETGDPVIMTNAAQKLLPAPLERLSKTQNAALLRALAKDPAKRFARCGEFVEALSGKRLVSAGRRGLKKGMMLSGIAAVALIGIWSAHAHQVRRAAELRAAQQRQKMDALCRDYDAALSSNDYAKAESVVVEIEPLNSDLAATLHERKESRAAEFNARASCDEARAAKAALLRRGLDPAQGFDEQLRDVNARWEEAESARISRKWGEAVTACTNLSALCRRLEAQEALRIHAREQRDAAHKERLDAEASKLSEGGRTSYRLGEQAFALASDAFEKGMFDVASEKWVAAGDAFREAAKLKRADVDVPTQTFIPEPKPRVVSELEKLVKDAMSNSRDPMKLAALFLARTNAPNTEIRSHIVNGVAAGLASVSKVDQYNQSVRPFVSDPIAFEKSLNVACDKCGGTSTQRYNCSACGGNGVCHNTGCFNGKTSRPVMGQGNVVGDCLVCRGSGKCVKCRGEGSKQGVCSACNGKGLMFSAGRAATVCVSELQAALAAFSALP